MPGSGVGRSGVQGWVGAVRRCSAAVLAVVVVLAAGGCRRAPRPTADEERRVPGQVVSFDGVPIVFERLGTGKTAVVLIHGWSCNRGYWENQLAALAERYTVVALDLPGHGASGSNREVWSVDSLGRDVAALVHELGLGRVILVGHSMGGPVSLSAARLLPRRVAGVVAVDSLHDAEMSFDSDEWRDAMDHFERDFAGTCELFVRGLYRSDAEPALVAWTIGDMCDARPEVARALLRSFGEFPFVDALAGAGAPVRAINSDMYPTAVEVNRRYNPDFDVVIMSGVGHFPQLERPAVFTEVLMGVLHQLDTTTAP